MTMAVRESAMLDRREEDPSAAQTIDDSCLTSLTDAVHRYFDLMYDATRRASMRCFDPPLISMDFATGKW